MKYTKKMKLVELDDISQPNKDFHHNTWPISDESYSKPYVLSSLDHLMEGILRKSGISDIDKWQLYNQSLQKYLNFVKVQSKKPEIMQNHSEDTQSYRNLTNRDDAFCTSNDLSLISGVAPLHDSLNSISVPSVKSFFEKVRESDASFVNNNSNVSMMSSSTNGELPQNHFVSNKRKEQIPNRKRSLTYGECSPVYKST